MTTCLATLPPSCLSLITRLLTASDITNLVLLVGDKLLLQKGATYGGVTELVGERPNRVNFLLSLAPPFAHLTHFIVGFGSALNTKVRFDRPWITELPPTLVVLRIGFANSLDFFVRPYDEDLDNDMHTTYVCSSNGYTTDRLDVRFPQLRSLQIHSDWPKSNPQWHLSMWMLYRLFYCLPASLTSLRFTTNIDDAFRTKDACTRLIASPRMVQNLTEFEWCLPFILQQVLLPAYDKTTDQERVAALMNLQTLHLDSYPNSDPSWHCLKELTNLQSLRLHMNTQSPAEADFAWPPRLTVLSADFFVSLDLAAQLRALPHLTSLRMHLKTTVPSWTVTFLPPLLKRWHVEWVADSGKLHLQCDLPSTLQHVSISGSIDAIILPQLQSLPHLQSLSLDEVRSDAFIAPSFPQLTALHLSLPVFAENFLLFPKSLTRFEGMLNLTSSCGPYLEGLQSWSPKALLNHLRLQSCPQIAEENFKLEVYNQGYMQFGAMEIVDYEPQYQFLSLSIDVIAPPPTLTRYVADEYWCKILLRKLPRGLVELRTAARWPLPEDARLPPNPAFSGSDLRADSEHHLPPALRILSVQSPSVFFDTDSGEPRMWPPLETAPLLETLVLNALPAAQLDTLKYLPTTITDLTLSRKIAGKPTVLATGLKHLTRLKRLTVSQFVIDLRIHLDLIKQLEEISFEECIIPRELVPEMKNPPNRILTYRDIHRQLQTIFPRRSRLDKARFDVNWDEGFFKGLPSSLKGLTLVGEYIPHFSELSVSFGSSLPQNLTRLSLIKYSLPHFFDTQCLPRTLLELSFSVDALLWDLPSDFTRRSDVRSISKNGFFTVAMAQGLPRGLQILVVRCAFFEVGALDAVPMTDLPDSSPASYASPPFPPELKALTLACTRNIGDASRHLFSWLPTPLVSLTLSPIDDHVLIDLANHLQPKHPILSVVKHPDYSVVFRPPYT